jgi:glucuronate isomerase
MSYSDRYFPVDPVRQKLARELYQSAKNLPLICPHGHVDPRLFSQEDYHFPNPVELIIQPDHYVLRILHSQGVPYESLGIAVNGSPVEKDPRRIWQIFADHFYCYSATPTGLWIRDELAEVFGIQESLTSANASTIYDAILDQLNTPDFTPRNLYHRFNIAVLSTTDAPSDSLENHKKITASGWGGHILPTFRSDSILHIERLEWLSEIEKLADASKTEIINFSSFLHAVEKQRIYFKEMGATATDLAVISAETDVVSLKEMDTLFQKGLKQTISPAESSRFVAGMLMELARMSADDGLIMQLHVGSLRNHDHDLFSSSGPDLGADFPVPVEFTRPLQTLLNRFGNHSNFHLILFTLDESTYSRELSPLASYYPAVKLGPPWWFHDSLNGMKRFFEQAIDSGGLYNTVGFNDDTRAFLSIPVRHDLWRRAAASWLAGLLAQHIVNETNAYQMMKALSCGLAVKAYGLEKYVPQSARL